MLSTLKELFDSFAVPLGGDTAEGRDHALRLAAAVLLVEVTRAEPSIGAAERRAVVAALRSRFSLSDDELARLVELAEAESRHMYDYHHFTSRINDEFSQEQKVALVEAMWQVAYADAQLDAQEIHLISKIAGLLHVTHGEYIGAKMRAKESSQLG